ncbi:MAG TPA: PAS domain S-box protein, partial [Geobacteraceae bacterium]
MRKRIYMTRTIVMVMLFFLLLIPMFFYLGINCFVRLIREEAHREALLTAGAAAARIDRHLQAANDRLRRLDAELSSRATEPRSRARILQQFAAAADSPFSGGLALYSPAGELLATDGDWHHTPSRLSSLARETAISASPRTTLLQDPGGTPAIILLAPIGRSHGRTGAVAVSCVHLGGPRGLASRGLLPDTNRLSVSSGPITIWLPDAPIVPKTPAATETTAAGLTVSAYTDEDFLARARTATGECWLILLGGGLFTALLTTVVVMRRLVNPLISLSSQVRAITTDDAREERVTIDPRSDVAGIADAFNRHMEMLAHKEQQLADKNRLLASILDTASVGICAFDPEGRHVLVNQAYCQLSGYAEDELLGQPFTLVLPVEVHDEALSLHREHCAGTIDVIPPVWEGVCKDGSRKIVSIQRNRLTLENGDILAIVVIRDITDLQRSLDALQESEQRYRDLAEFLPQTVFETDLNGRITFVNQAAFIIFGHGMEALEQGLTVLDILAQEDHERARANMGRSLRGENTPVAGNEYIAHRQNGSTFPVLIHSAPLLRHGLVVGLRGILVDITDVKRAEMQLRIKERAIDASINGIAFAGPDSRITSANQSFLRLWGYGSEAEVIGREVASFWTQPHRAAAAAATVIEKGSWAGILVARRADGSTFDAQVSTSAVYDDDGRPVSLMASFIDITEKLRVENALRQSEEKFRAIVETTQELVWTMGLDGRHTYINPALRDILGLAPDDFIGRPLEALLHPDDVALAHRTLEEAVSGVSGWTGIVLRWRHRDGSWRYLESNAAPMFSPDGVLAGFLGADRDITARILAEEELQETQRRFTDILTNVKLASVILNADGIVTFCNDFLLELGGWQRHELLGANWFDLFIPASDRDRMKAFFCSSISLGEIAPHFENPIVTRSGETCLIRWNNTLLYDRQGLPSGTASIGENITRKREAEEALRKSEERYRTLFQGAYEAIIVLRDGCIVECNQRALELFRCSREEILGHPPTDFSPPLQADGLDSEESARQKTAAALAGTPQHYEWRLRHADGTETDVEATLCRLEYEGGVELMAIGRDVTLRKKTEQALLLAKKTADAASRAKSEFLAN